MLYQVRKHMTNKNNDEYGFTLIELLVVILIIGVLASIAIPAFLNQRQRATDAQTQQDLRTANIAINTWIIGNPSSNSFVTSELNELYNVSKGTSLQIIGTPQDYCIKAFNENGRAYRNTGGPYLLHVSVTGETRTTAGSAGASSLSCGTGPWLNLR